MAQIAVVVTAKDMYEELKGLRQDVSAMRGEINQLPSQVADHESRIRKMETQIQQNVGAASSWKTWVPVLLAAVAVLTSVAPFVSFK